MKKNILLKVILGTCVLISLVAGIVGLKENITEKDLKAIKVESITSVENENFTDYDYKITTDTRLKTLQNDGGSHVNVYYTVDFKNNLIVKYEDKYVGFKGYEYKDKVVYKKTISKSKSTKLKSVIDELADKEDINTDNNYFCYTIEFGNNKVEIYNEDSIEALKYIINVL